MQVKVNLNAQEFFTYDIPTTVGIINNPYIIMWYKSYN